MRKEPFKYKVLAYGVALGQWPPMIWVNVEKPITYAITTITIASTALEVLIENTRLSPKAIT
jgi:hypothetical protein